MAETTMDRDYTREAVAIAAGGSKLLPEVEHVRALAAQMESVLQNQRFALEMLAAVMVDTGQSQFVLPQDLLGHVRQQGLEILIESSERFVRVRIFRRPLGAGAVN